MRTVFLFCAMMKRNIVSSTATVRIDWRVLRVRMPLEMELISSLITLSRIR